MLLRAAAAALVLVASGVSHASDFDDDPQGPALCASLKRQLRRLPRSTPLSAWPSKLDYPGLKRPIWRDISPEEGRDAAIQILGGLRSKENLWHGGVISDDMRREGEAEFDALAKAGSLHLQRGFLATKYGKASLVRLRRRDVGLGTVGKLFRRSSGSYVYYSYAFENLSGVEKIKNWTLVPNGILGADIFSFHGGVYFFEIPFGPVKGLNFTEYSSSPAMFVACDITVDEGVGIAIHRR